MAFQIDLDEQSLKILKTVDPIHRYTLINMGLRLVQGTEFYKLLTGDIKGDDISESITNLDINSSEAPIEEPKKVNTTWDSF
jgi:hypothetical protein